MADSPEFNDTFVSNHPPERLVHIQRLRWVALTCLVTLILLGLAWELKLAPLAGGTGALAFKVLPLCLAISGMLKHRMYTFRWVSLMVWLYFTEGVVRATSDKGLSQSLAMIETALSVVLFVACAVYIRLRLRVLPGKTAKSTD